MKKRKGNQKKTGVMERRICKCYIVSLLVAIAGVSAYAAGDIFSAGENLIEDARNFFLLASTPIAVIGVGCGAFMKKLSFGDPQKIKNGTSLIWASIIGWTVINGLTLILNTIKNYL